MPARRISRNAIAVAITVAAAFTILVFRLLVPPIVGLADNGDFSRLALPTGLASMSASEEDRYFGWMQPRFRLVARMADPGGYRSSEVLLIELAVRASRALGHTSVFDLRVLAALHILLLLAARGLVWACRDLSAAAQVVAAALLVFFFTDVGFVALFNSLYSQTASFLFLMLTVAIAALAVRRGRLAGLQLPAYFLCAALWITSKPQEIIHAPLLAVFGLSMAWRGSRRRSRAAAVALSLALCALAWRYHRSADRSLGWITRYNMLFMEILPNSPDPRGDLVELGLDPSWARFAGVSAWAAESPARDPEVRAFADRRSGPSPRLFLLRHPERLASLLARTARVSCALRPHDLGNFAKETGAAPLQKASGIWSDLRIHLSGFPWLAVLLGGTFAAAGTTYRRASTRGRRVREGLALLVVMAVNAFLVSAIGDSQEIIRHLYTFHALCDLIFVADATWLTSVAGAALGGLLAHRRAARQSRLDRSPDPSLRSGSRNASRFARLLRETLSRCEPLKIAASRAPCYPPRPLAWGCSSVWESA